MGIYLNPGNEAFCEAARSKIYVDKTDLIEYTNSVLATSQKHICVSRPRRFGKSITASMLTAYYSRGCDSRALFSAFKIDGYEDFSRHLNLYNTIFLNMQEFLSRSATVEELIQRVQSAVMRDIVREYPEIHFF